MKVNIGRYPKGDKERKVEVELDPWDMWDASHTLALIIVPVLKKLREEKHGAPNVDCEDVIPPLRIDAAKDKGDPDVGGVDDLYFDRWNYVLDEMIWAFTQQFDDSEEATYHHNRGQLAMETKPITEGKMAGLYELKINDQKDPTKPKYWRDDEGLNLYEERIRNGHRLFGKYYQCLWD